MNRMEEVILPFNTRGAVAMWGDLGYELDLTKMSDEESDQVVKQVTEYKKIREVTQFGTLYRLKASASNQCAWMMVAF